MEIVKDLKLYNNAYIGMEKDLEKLLLERGVKVERDGTVFRLHDCSGAEFQRLQREAVCQHEKRLLYEQTWISIPYIPLYDTLHPKRMDEHIERLKKEGMYSFCLPHMDHELVSQIYLLNSDLRFGCNLYTDINPVVYAAEKIKQPQVLKIGKTDCESFRRLCREMEEKDHFYHLPDGTLIGYLSESERPYGFSIGKRSKGPYQCRHMIRYYMYHETGASLYAVDLLK